MADRKSPEPAVLDQPGVPEEAAQTRINRVTPATADTEYDRETLISQAAGFSEDLDLEVTPEMVAGAIRLHEVTQHQERLRTQPRAPQVRIEQLTRAETIKALRQFAKRQV